VVPLALSVPGHLHQKAQRVVGEEGLVLVGIENAPRLKDLVVIVDHGHVPDGIGRPHEQKSPGARRLVVGNLGNRLEKLVERLRFDTWTVRAQSIKLEGGIADRRAAPVSNGSILPLHITRGYFTGPHEPVRTVSQLIPQALTIYLNLIWNTHPIQFSTHQTHHTPQARLISRQNARTTKSYPIHPPDKHDYPPATQSRSWTASLQALKFSQRNHSE